MCGHDALVSGAEIGRGSAKRSLRRLRRSGKLRGWTQSIARMRCMRSPWPLRLEKDHDALSQVRTCWNMRCLSQSAAGPRGSLDLKGSTVPSRTSCGAVHCLKVWSCALFESILMLCALATTLIKFGACLFLRTCTVLKCALLARRL